MIPPIVAILKTIEEVKISNDLFMVICISILPILMITLIYLLI